MPATRSVRNKTPDSAGEWVEKLARFGYAAKGVVFVVIGAMAIAAAFMAGQQITGSEGALTYIAGKPYGQFLLGLVGLGLLAYALWRFVQAIKDPEHNGHDARGIATRIGYFVSGVIYAGLAVTAWGIIFGSGGGGGDDTQSRTAQLMAQPFGRWLVALVGLIVAGLGFGEFYQAWSARFMKHIRTWQIEPETAKWVRTTGRAGRAARGVVFLIIGTFLLIAAWQYDPQEARGMEGALQALQQQPYGPWLLAVVGLGLLAYGLFQFVNARYRAISPNPLA